MNNKSVDKTKKSNIKCEHCNHWNRVNGKCDVTKTIKNYYQRCNQFDWLSARNTQKENDV